MICVSDIHNIRSPGRHFSQTLGSFPSAYCTDSPVLQRNRAGPRAVYDAGKAPPLVDATPSVQAQLPSLKCGFSRLPYVPPALVTACSEAKCMPALPVSLCKIWRALLTTR